MFILPNFPMGVSDNRLKRNSWGSPVPRRSDEYKAYEQEVMIWERSNRKLVQEVSESLKAPLGVHFDLYFTHDRLITKKGATKRLDASNYLKCLCDSLSKIIKIDDSEFWEVSVRKQVGAVNFVTIKIYEL